MKSALRRIAPWGRRAATLLLAALGLSLLLGGFAELLAPESPRQRPAFDRDERNRVETARATQIDPANPVVLWQEVDYAADHAAWRPSGEPLLLEPLVTEGVLPSVDERVGREPLVLAGPEGPGRYGGSLIVAQAIAGGNTIDMDYRYSGAGLVRWSPYGYPIVPHLAKSWEIRDEFREYRITLRSGLRWSDGEPFTTADILYYINHELRDPAVNIGDNTILLHRGQWPDIEALSDTLLVIRFADPYPTFLEKLAIAKGHDLCRSPAHYLRPYHPTEGDPDVIARALEEFGLSNPTILYLRLRNWANPQHPRMWPWIYRARSANPPHIFVRNPYYFAVDAWGNQLPYADAFIIQDRQGDMARVAAVNGELSYFDNLPFGSYTMAMAQRDRGNYRVLHWDPLNRSEFLIFPNLNYDIVSDAPESAKKRRLIQTPEFRQALSLAMDRKRISEIEFNGLLVPEQMAPVAQSPFHEPALTHAFVEHDPERAGELLNAIGLDQRDEEGWRTYPDGTPLILFFDFLIFESRDLAQMIADQWQAVGLHIISRYRADRIWRVDLDAFLLELSAGRMNGKINLFVEPKNYVATDQSHWSRAWGQWYSRGGLYGNVTDGAIAPPEDSVVRDIMELHDRASSAPGLDQQKAIFSEALQLSASHLWTINTGRVPFLPVIVKDGLRNVPDLAVRNWDFMTPSNCAPELFFWEDPESMGGNVEGLRDSLIRPPDSFAGAGNAVAATGSDLATLLHWMKRVLLIGFIGILGYSAVAYPFIARRLLIMVPTLGVISVIVFVIVQLPPGDFLTSVIARLEASGSEVDTDTIEALRDQFELDKPGWQRYLTWVGLTWFTTFRDEDRGLIQGDLGLAMENQRPVNEVVGDRFALTFAISFLAILTTWCVALPIGVYSAVKQYSWGDYAATFLGFVGMSVPNFLLALILMFLSNRYFNVPITGLFSAEFVGQQSWDLPKLIDLLKHIWVPVLVLAVTGAAGMIRVMRGNLLDELNKPYVVTARAKGVRPVRLLVKYPVRLALNPFVSGLGALFPQLVSGGAIVALILSLPTVGPLLLKALQMEDMYTAGSMLMILSMLGIVGTLVSDLLLMVLDPRIRMEGGRSR